MMRISKCSPIDTFIVPSLQRGSHNFTPRRKV